jgi:two-component system nitrogen regulation sensor histidine kinase GlnL
VKAGLKTDGANQGGRTIPESAVLAALPDPIVVVGADGVIAFANPAAEQFFATGASVLAKQKFDDLVPFGSPLLALIQQVRRDGNAVSEHDIDLGTPKFGIRSVDIQVAPVVELPGHVVVRFEDLGVARHIDRQLTYRGAVRSVTGMAAVLAHEVKNPLSGIRGAAQLLEPSLGAPDRDLVRLICEETDRICALVDRMEVFADKRPIARGPVNIHRVLEHVRKLAGAGFAKHVRFVEHYDPSLPPVLGNRDQLVQVFLNLVKNAAEAATEADAEITLSTAFRPGVRLAIRGGADRLRLPLVVTVQDNGPGVPDDILPHLFEPFVSGKARGTGLGLALVGKIVGDHGGVIECEKRPKGTAFHVRLPVDDGGQGGER